MILKLLGGVILLLAGGYVSLAVGRFERRRLRVLDGYIALIYYIKGQIDCYALPVRDILARADPALIAACLGLDVPLGEQGSAPLADALARETAPLPALLRESRLYLEPETERLLHTFSGELGRTHRTEQVARCDHYITALGEERRRLAEALPARLRVTGTLLLTTALGAAILLW